MPQPFPMPLDPIKEPQLSLLAILQKVLEMTELVLLSVYPDHWNESSPSGSRSEEEAYVDAIFHQIHALEGTLQSYECSLRRRACSRCHGAPPQDEDIPL